MALRKLSMQDITPKENIWCAGQPAGNINTNRAFRMAKCLPLSFSHSSYEWCLDFKNMGRQCRTGKVTRPWTEEEMMAYLDWCNSEDARVEGVVRKDIEFNGFRTLARGTGYLWAQVYRDIGGKN